MPAVSHTGKISGAYKLPKPKDGSTHFADWNGKQVGLDADNFKIIKTMLDQITKTAADAKAARLAQHIPGLEVLRSAINAHDDYQRGFERMMEDEQNDGVNPPRLPGADPDELAKQYPRAAAYLRADAYSDAAHDQKANAGRKAKELLESGGSIEDAESILANWLPKSAQWN